MDRSRPIALGSCNVGIELFWVPLRYVLRCIVLITGTYRL